MSYYIEGTLKQVSLRNGTFRLSPKKEYMQEKDGKKYLVCVEKKKKTKSTDSSSSNGGSERLKAILLCEDSEFKFECRGWRLFFIANSKSAVGIEIKVPTVSAALITVLDVIVL